MSYITMIVGVQWADLPKDDSYPDIPILLGLVDGQELHRIQRHWIFGFDLANDNLQNKILEKIQAEFNVGGCHGWRTAYASPNGGFEVFEYDFERYEECPGSNKPVGTGSRCESCGKSFGFPHPANLTVGRLAPSHESEPPFKDEADKRAEDWKD
jgi:hypothetical protein